MPNGLIRKLSHEHHVPKQELEHVFKKVAKNAKKEHMNNPYAVATKISERYAQKHGK